MKYYIIQSFNLPFVREWNIYNNWFSTDKSKLIERVRRDLEEEALLEPTTLVESDGGWLICNNDTSEKWLRITELEEIKDYT